MKRTELEKQQGKKVTEQMRRAPVSERFGSASSGIHDKREQRRREAAAGLVPFAVKLPADLVAALQARAQRDGVALNDLAATLLAGALEGASTNDKDTP